MSALIGNPLLLTSAPSGGDDAYQIEKSLRFNSADSAYLKRTPSTKGNRRIFTISFWIKHVKGGSWPSIIGADSSSNNRQHFRYLDADGGMQIYFIYGGNQTLYLAPNAKYRDYSGWQHWCLAVDTTQAVESDRGKFYHNGVRVTSFSSATYPAQNLEFQINNAQAHSIGRRDYDTSQYANMYMADTYIIDGLALSPAAFGSFDSLGIWNPKEFALPAPNDGTTWSGQLTAKRDGSSESITNPTYAFNGETSDAAVIQITADDQVINLTWTPTTAITAQTLRIYVHSGGEEMPVHCSISDGPFVNIRSAFTSNVTQWIDVSDNLPADGKITKIELKRDGETESPMTISLYAIEIDGVILRDGETDVTTRSNLNNGATWSSAFAFSNGQYSDHAPAKAFNGNLSDNATSQGSNQTFTWTPAGTLAYAEKVEVYNNDNTDHTYNLNGGSNIAGQGWLTLATGSGTITTINGSDSSDYCKLAAVRVDGHILIDDTVDNSFHLKFNDTAGTRNLGYSQVMNTPTGAQPMYGPGADDSAKASLVWALPGYDTADHSHTIKGSGSAVGHTVNGSVVSTTQSKFYGSSLYFDGSNDDIQSPVSTDFQLGTSDFTIEGWFYMPSSGFTAPDGWIQCSAGNDDWSMLPFYRSSDGNLYFYGTATSGDWDWSAKNYGAIATDKWTHYAVVRNGSTFKGYTNGKEAWTFTDSGTVYQAENQMNIGSTQTGGNAFAIGYLNDFRYYKGAAKYTANFTPPTRNDFTVNNLTSSESAGMHGKAVATATGAKPVLVTTDTYGAVTDGSTRSHSTSNLLLALALNTTSNLTDDKSSSNRTMTNNGTVTATTDATAYYGGVALFNSNSQNLTTSSSNFDFGGSSNPTNFTVEMWFYTTQNKDYSALYDTRTSASDSNGYTITINNDGEIYMYGDNGFRCRSGTGAIKENQWYHVALQRNTNTFELFLDGVLIDSVSHNMHPSRNGQYIGNNGWNNGDPFKGYIQDVRVYATRKYTGDFIVTRPKFPASDIDSFVDSPTSYGEDTGLGGEVRGNYATLNPLLCDSNITLKNGNLQFDANSNHASVAATLGIRTGKWYWEMTRGSGTNWPCIGIKLSSLGQTTILNSLIGDPGFFIRGMEALYLDGTEYTGGVMAGYTQSAGETIGFAFDADAGKIWARKVDGSWANSGDPANGTGAVGTGFHTDLDESYWLPVTKIYDGTDTMNFGARAFENAAPTGFKALCTHSLPDTFSGAALNNPSKYFSVTTYTGTGAEQDIEGLGFQPDLVFLKERSSSREWQVYDAVRGATKKLECNDGFDIETTVAQGLKSFDTDGFTLGTETASNTNTETYVAHVWDAGTAASGANNDGSVNIASGDQWKNTTAGFSITKFTPPGSGNYSVGHGLAAKPEFVITKNLENNAGYYWNVYHKSLGIGKVLVLNDTDAADTDANYFPSEPTNTLFNLGTKGQIAQTDEYIMYAWTSIPGYSAFGKYTGNGNAAGPFIYTGFSVKWLLIKQTNSANSWSIVDIARDSTNPTTGQVYADSIAAEATGTASRDRDLLSNGFRPVGTSAEQNGSGDTYIYAAFAEHPFKTSRAR